MEIVSTSPLRVASLVWQRTPVAWVQTVVCKATFELFPGEAKLALDQDPVHEDDRPRDGDPARSLYAASDLAPYKLRADVLLVGQAFAPGGAPARSLVARLVVGAMEKSVLVSGDRAAFAPLGFGPIASASPSRAHFLRDQPLPSDFDPAYFNVAPPDQQVAEIRPDEPIVLENLHPDLPRLMTRLPNLAAQAWLHLPGVPPQRVRMLGDTLWIDTDRAVATVTWRGQIPLKRPDEAGKVVVTLDKPGAPKSEIRKAPPRDAGSTLPLDTPALADDPLPFARTAPREQAPSTPVPPPPPIQVREVPPPAPIAPLAADPTHAGVLAASNAAAGVSAKPPGPAGDAKAAPEAKPAREKPREVIELLWYDPAAVPRIRRNLAWKKIIADLKPRPSDDDFDGGLPPDQMKAAKDKRDVLGVLARGEVMDMEGIRRAMEMAVLEDGSFVPPYVLTAGTLEMLFDEMETLKATLIAVAPFVPLDKKLKEAVDYVNEVMKTPGIERARGVVAGLCERVRVAFAQQGRGVPSAYLDETLEGALVEGRCWRRTTTLGGHHVSSALVQDGGRGAVPVYLAEDGERGLPATRRLDARLIAGARAERRGAGAAGVELVVVALARQLAL